MLNIVILAPVLLLAAYLAFSKKPAASSDGKATATPLASIMGSGFLVSAPLLAGVLAFLVARERRDLPRRGLHLVHFALVAVTCLLVFSMGLPSE